MADADEESGVERLQPHRCVIAVCGCLLLLAALLLQMREWCLRVLWRRVVWCGSLMAASSSCGAAGEPIAKLRGKKEKGAPTLSSQQQVEVAAANSHKLNCTPSSRVQHIHYPSPPLPLLHAADAAGRCSDTSLLHERASEPVAVRHSPTALPHTPSPPRPPTTWVGVDNAARSCARIES